MTALPDFDGTPIWSLSKSRYNIVVCPRRYCGTDFLDLREWVAGNEPKPTVRGVTIPLDRVADLAAALTAFACTASSGGP